jgi:hypothetical protein
MIRPVGLESPSEGGTQTAKDLTEVDSRTDAVSVAGVFLQGGTTTADRQVLLDRSGSQMRLADSTTTRVLSDLMCNVAGGVNAHNAIRDIQHFLGNEGPGDGFASGAYLQRSFSGPLLTSEIWFTSSQATTKIISKTLAYPSGSPLPSTITWVVYGASGAALRTMVDTLSYSGPVCYAVTRTWS